ncbi:MAG TPA: hypothetical protein VMY77_00465 [Chitinophagaceae bacterium]|nr:hypothetical protein [Chitinophagaceae bacterium]
MILLILAIAILITSFCFAKQIARIRLQVSYERALLKGNKTKASHLGRQYYLALDDESRKAKGIFDIDARISEDFNSFNRYSLKENIITENKQQTV